MMRQNKLITSERTDEDHSAFIKILIILFLIFLLYLLRNSWQKDNIVTTMILQSFPTYLGFNTTTSDTKKYISSNLAANSRLGNHLFELSSLLAISRKLKRTPTFFIASHYHDQMLKDTDFLIPGLIDQFLIVNQTIPESIVPTEFGRKCCIFDEPERLKQVTDEYLHLAGHHYQSWKYFARMRNKLIRYLKTPTNNFTDLPKSEESTFISCVHIRRTDFVGTGFHVPEKEFIMNSIKYMEIEEKKRQDVNMTTVFFGDDFQFMEGLVNETLTWRNDTAYKTDSFISQNSPSDDILYAAHHCDVVLITSPHSTFGWWMGFFSKGNEVYYNDIKFTDDRSIASGNFNPDDYFPPYWTPIKYEDNHNITVIESLK
ncbi:unnamed protein product [Caenorhabditis brenneri]